MMRRAGLMKEAFERAAGAFGSPGALCEGVSRCDWRVRCFFSPNWLRSAGLGTGMGDYTTAIWVTIGLTVALTVPVVWQFLQPNDDDFGDLTRRK